MHRALTNCDLVRGQYPVAILYGTLVFQCIFWTDAAPIPRSMAYEGGKMQRVNGGLAT